MQIAQSESRLIFAMLVKVGIADPMSALPPVMGRLQNLPGYAPPHDGVILLGWHRIRITPKTT